MPSYIVEIHPSKAAYDPLARHVKAELAEQLGADERFDVKTRRLYRIEAAVAEDAVKAAARDLLADPVIEAPDVRAESGAAKKEKASDDWVIDVWPKPGVTDPVGETVEHALKTLGWTGEIRVAAGVRTVVTKIKDEGVVRALAKATLGNELVHDIRIHKPN